MKGQRRKPETGDERRQYLPGGYEFDIRPAPAGQLSVYVYAACASRHDWVFASLCHSEEHGRALAEEWAQARQAPLAG